MKKFMLFIIMAILAIPLVSARSVIKYRYNHSYELKTKNKFKDSNLVDTFRYIAVDNDGGRTTYTLCDSQGKPTGTNPLIFTAADYNEDAGGMLQIDDDWLIFGGVVMYILDLNLKTLSITNGHSYAMFVREY